MSLEPVKQKPRILLLWAICLTVAFCFICGAPVLQEGTVYHEGIEAFGLALVFVAIVGRLWSILYVGAKKNQELVTTGPYSLTRNPLYFFSICGLVGVGFIFGSLILAGALLAVVSIVFSRSALAEARYLRTKFGTKYEVYESATPLLVPTRWTYNDTAEITLSTKALSKTFYDCIPLMMAYPLIELVEWGRAASLLKPFFYLP